MKYGVVIFIICACFACQKEGFENPLPEPAMLVPKGFPTPIFPDDNTLTDARVALGKALFYEKAMSVDSSVSCASCHLAQFAFADTATVSKGVANRLGTRNAPSLANVAYQPHFLREGAISSLEMQVLVPVQEHNEFDFNILLIAERLQQDTHYMAMSQAAYSKPIDYNIITRALATFERTMLSGESDYDNNTLSNAAQRGKNLFFSSQLACSTCHNNFNFSNYAFENNGLYDTYPDIGRARLTNQDTDIGRFKVPSLRNVGLTAPYMYDGSLKTLEAVVNHYNSGGKGHPNQSPLIKPLGLNAQEKSDLIAFLNGLTDWKFVNNPKFIY